MSLQTLSASTCYFALDSFAAPDCPATIDTREDAIHMLGMLLHLTLHRAIAEGYPACVRVGTRIVDGCDHAIAMMEMRFDALDARGDVPMSRRSDGTHISVARGVPNYAGRGQSVAFPGRDEIGVFGVHVNREGVGDALRYRVRLETDINHPVMTQAVETWHGEHLRLIADRSRKATR